MARSKSTARAEARRRYRAAQVEAEAAAQDTDQATDRQDRATAGLRPPGGLRSLFSFRRPDWRGDIDAFPELLRTQRSLWVAIGAIVLGTVACIGLTRTSGQIALAGILLQLLLYVPSIPLLLAGYFAPRAAWLEGLVLGTLSLVGILAVNYLGGATPPTLTLVGAIGLVVQWPIFGSVFGALAAWYRSWLRKSNDSARKSREERDRRKRQEAKAKGQARPQTR
ncbi:MAG: hypothetical protein ACRDGL_05360 [Candidatus Limnocylindrales bacterium]